MDYRILALVHPIARRWDGRIEQRQPDDDDGHDAGDEHGARAHTGQRVGAALLLFGRFGNAFDRLTAAGTELAIGGVDLAAALTGEIVGSLLLDIRR